jgi:hypothetical protein
MQPLTRVLLVLQTLTPTIVLSLVLLAQLDLIPPLDQALASSVLLDTT